MLFLRRSRWRLMALLASCGLLLVAWLFLPKLSNLWELGQARQRWSAAQISHYRYVGKPSCFCPPEYLRALRIEISNGQVVSRVYDEDGSKLMLKESQGLGTIEAQFDMIQETVQQGGKVRATYDRQFGYPTIVALDPIPDAMDDEFFFQISDFAALP
jgi:hypothetical protein